MQLKPLKIKEFEQNMHFFSFQKDKKVWINMPLEPGEIKN